MEEKAPYGAPCENAKVFTRAFDRYNDPGRIVHFGPYYAVAQVLENRAALQYIVREGLSGYSAASLATMRQGVQWTKWINDFNKGRKWVLKRLLEKLDPMLEGDIAIATVPSHDPFQDAPSIRLLAQQLATGGRVDATSCLVRHTKIKRIVFGGPSYRALHRQTISVVNASLVQGRNVLLLDDIVRSGASLRACRELLYQAGARLVQAAALGEVVAGRE
jgi:phosphoribosylpyrophosphate synthetase